VVSTLAHQLVFDLIGGGTPAISEAAVRLLETPGA
jgi:hypothetical protein